MERAFMQEGGVTSDEYLRFAAEESGNVAADGMFSIQVQSGFASSHMQISSLRTGGLFRTSTKLTAPPLSLDTHAAGAAESPRGVGPSGDPAGPSRRPGGQGGAPVRGGLHMQPAGVGVEEWCEERVVHRPLYAQ